METKQCHRYIVKHLGLIDCALDVAFTALKRTAATAAAGAGSKDAIPSFADVAFMASNDSLYLAEARGMTEEAVEIAAEKVRTVDGTRATQNTAPEIIAMIEHYARLLLVARGCTSHELTAEQLSEAIREINAETSVNTEATGAPDALGDGSNALQRVSDLQDDIRLQLATLHSSLTTPVG